MSSYTKSTNFAAKDSLPSGNPGKIVKGTEIDTEFNNIATAVNSKADSANPTITGVASFDDGSASAPVITNTGDTNTGVFFPAGDTIGFANGGSETARIDSSGNLGLGVTPSAWGGFSANRVFQTGGAAFFGRTDTPDAYVGTNAYRDSANTWKYNTTNPAGYYQLSGNTHNWFIAPSGTAGNAITWTQAMTLDASGNLGIGTTSPNAAGWDRAVTLDGTTSSAVEIKVGGSRKGEFAALSGGVYIQTVGSIPVVFSTNSTERARIDSSGNLLVGTTTATVNGRSGRMVVAQSGDSLMLTQNSNTSYALYSYVSTGSGTRYHMGFADGSTASTGTVGSITTNGTSTSYVTTSDYRLKENIQPMQNALGVVTQLNPVTYNWKADGSEGQGFIAHELQAVVPDCVTGEKDAVDADGNPVYQGIDTSFLVATLTKAIQEQQALIQTLTARLDALEGK